MLILGNLGAAFQGIRINTLSLRQNAYSCVRLFSSALMGYGSFH